MSGPIRFSAEKQQERISRSQFRERLTEFGWIASRPDEDLGEDFIVHIYYRGQATGVTFHVQLKSITNLHEQRKGDFLVYDDIKVKDLKHWEDFSQPVVLVVWDVELREGRWALVEDVIAELDQRRPKWRENKSKVRVRLPWGNTTDDLGLTRLKQSIGWHFYPLISRDKSLEMQMKLNFPDTEEGKIAREAFNRFLKEGGQVTFKGKIIQELKFSEWLTCWFGDYDPDNVQVTIGSQISSKTFPVDIYIISVNRETSSIRNIELKVIKSGTEVVQLSNEHQNSPLRLRLTIRNLEKCQEIDMSYRLNNLGQNVYETRNVLRFLQGLTSGGILRLTRNDYFIETNVPPNPEKSPTFELLEFVDKLCTIQDKTGQFIQMSIEGLTNEDVRATNELVAIIEHGKTIKKHPEITIDFQRETLKLILEGYSQGKPITHIMIPVPESFVELFGQKIQAGRMTRYVTGILEISITELEEVITTLAPNEYLGVKFIDVEIAETFPDWFIREANRLSQRLIEKFEAEAVYLFGSLVWSDIHAPETDIDLAVRGLSPERYLEAMSYLERASNFPVDLVELEKVSDHLRERILAEGKLLSEREPAITPG